MMRCLAIGSSWSCGLVLLAACAGGPQHASEAPQRCQPLQCPAHTEVREVPSANDPTVQWQFCQTAEGNNHGPAHCCRDGLLVERLLWQHNRPVRVHEYFEHGRLQSKAYISHHTGIMSCVVDGDEERCEHHPYLGLQCAPLALPERKAFLVDDSVQLVARVGCLTEAQQQGLRVDWQLYRVVLLRLPKVQIEGRSYRPFFRLNMQGSDAMLHVSWSEECPNSGYPREPEPGGTTPAAQFKDVLVAMELPRRIRRVDFDVKRHDMWNRADCNTIP